MYGTGSASFLPPGVTSCQRPQTFREQVADLYVNSVSLRGLSRILALFGCGVGIATLWRNLQAVAPDLAPDPEAKLPAWFKVDETWLSLGGVKRPVAVVLGTKGKRLDLYPTGLGFDWTGWFEQLEQHGVWGMTTDDDPVYGATLKETGLDRRKLHRTALPWAGPCRTSGPATRVWAQTIPSLQFLRDPHRHAPR